MSERSIVGIRIRPATAQDATSLLRCLAEAFEPYRAQYTEAAFQDTVLTPETVRDRIRSMRVLVAIDTRGAVVGTLGWSKESPSAAHLRGMAVLPSCQGQGVAQALLDRALTEVAQEGCTRVSLDTTPPLLRAIRFYDRNGFRPSGRVSDFFGMSLVERTRSVGNLGARLASLSSGSLHPSRTRTMKVVIGLVGPGGTGKGEVSRRIHERIGGTDVELRKIVEDDLRSTGTPLTNVTLRERSSELRAKYGPDIIARRSVDEVRRALGQNDVVVVDSMKSPEEVEYFRRELPARFILLSIEAATDTRFERLKSRGRPWDVSQPGEVTWRDGVESKWGMDRVVALAEYRIVNDGSIDGLTGQVEDFLRTTGLVDAGSPGAGVRAAR
jgi:ribosomal protein S18 acetylase RimI-like enzyme/dephospho-CoA kinase